MKNLKLDKQLNECRKHIRRLESASVKMNPFMPIDEHRYENLSDDEVEHIDQFLFRFAKLQDAIGEKLFRGLLDFLLEPDISRKPSGRIGPQRNTVMIRRKLKLPAPGVVRQGD